MTMDHLIIVSLMKNGSIPHQENFKVLPKAPYEIEEEAYVAPP